MKTIAKSGLKVKAGIKAGGWTFNHNRGGLKVKAGIKAGGWTFNHNRDGLKLKAGVRAGYEFVRNHNLTLRAI